ncbi:hypothetical protein ABK040_005766 [Willaertia magna]
MKLLIITLLAITFLLCFYFCKVEAINQDLTKTASTELEELLQEENKQLKKVIKDLKRKYEGTEEWLPTIIKDNFFDKTFKKMNSFRKKMMKSLFPAKKMEKSLRAVVKKESDNLYSVDIANIPTDILDKKDFEITVDHTTYSDLLTIKAEKKITKENRDSFYRYYRAFSFPKGTINREAVKANFSNGKLHLDVPVEEPKPKVISVE